MRILFFHAKKIAIRDKFVNCKYSYIEMIKLKGIMGDILKFEVRKWRVLHNIDLHTGISHRSTVVAHEWRDQPSGTINQKRNNGWRKELSIIKFLPCAAQNLSQNKHDFLAEVIVEKWHQDACVHQGNFCNHLMRN